MSQDLPHTQDFAIKPVPDHSGPRAVTTAWSLRAVRLKILYTFDDGSNTNCLARWPNVIQVQAIEVDVATIIGVIELQTCVKAVVAASPELVAHLAEDYSVYAYDYSEDDTPLVGQGMLSWALASAPPPPGAPARPSRTMITGRVCTNILSLFTNGAEETLEVRLRLVRVPQCLQSEYLCTMERYLELSRVMPADFDPSAWATFTEAHPGWAGVTDREVPQMSESPFEEATPGQDSTDALFEDDQATVSDRQEEPQRPTSVVALSIQEPHRPTSVVDLSSEDVVPVPRELLPILPRPSSRPGSLPATPEEAPGRSSQEAASPPKAEAHVSAERPPGGSLDEGDTPGRDSTDALFEDDEPTAAEQVEDKRPPHLVSELVIEEVIPGPRELLPTRILPRPAKKAAPSRATPEEARRPPSRKASRPLRARAPLKPVAKSEPAQPPPPIVEFVKPPQARVMPAPAKLARSGSGIKRRRAIERRLEEAKANGELAPYCSHCGNIDTPTWRKVCLRTFPGPSEALRCASAGDKSVIAIMDVTQDAEGKVTSHTVARKPDQNLEDGWTLLQLCNPCGIWLAKKGKMRPMAIWDKKRKGASGGEEEDEEEEEEDEEDGEAEDEAPTSKRLKTTEGERGGSNKENCPPSAADEQLLPPPPKTPTGGWGQAQGPVDASPFTDYYYSMMAAGPADASLFTYEPQFADDIFTDVPMPSSPPGLFPVYEDPAVPSAP
ncbi:MAG: hypothetical protein M1832_004282 [Thelocarpon impressellum]|nr:MAG: hypothetical protein M1832_004282 [Thelocarpon impressellum]